MAYELDRQRRADRRYVQESRRQSHPPATLGKITTASPAVGKFLNWNPVTMQGGETEGGTPTLTAQTGITIKAELVQGSAAQNDIVLFRWADWHWVTDGRGAIPNPCAGHGNTITFTLTGCNSLAAVGATVNFVLGGSTVHSATTNGIGRVVYTDPAPGAYTLNWTYGAMSGSTGGTITSGCNSILLFGSLGATAGVGFVCCPSCIWPVPNFLTITDANSTQGMTKGVGGSFWGSDGYQWTVGPPGDEETHTIFYRLDCNGDLQQQYYIEKGGVNLHTYATDLGTVDVCSWPFPTFSGTIPPLLSDGTPNPAAGPYTGGP